MFYFSKTYAQLNVQAGLNSSSIKYSTEGISIETGSLTSFHAGVNYRSRVGNSFFFSPGLHLSMKGSSYDFDLFGQSEDVKTNLTYVEVPLMFIYQSDPEKGFFAEGGPYLGALMSASTEDEDVKDEFKSIDLGIGLGVGYDFGQFMLGLRGMVSLTNIAEDADGGKASNQVGQLYGAYKF